jgi:hypothetical protein
MKAAYEHASDAAYLPQLHGLVNASIGHGVYARFPCIAEIQIQSPNPTRITRPAEDAV